MSALFCCGVIRARGEGRTGGSAPSCGAPAAATGREETALRPPATSLVFSAHFTIGRIAFSIGTKKGNPKKLSHFEDTPACGPLAPSRSLAEEKRVAQRVFSLVFGVATTGSR